jgi:hypothetical protein
MGLGRDRVTHEGIGHARRMSNWTAAALIAGAGAATVALAHHSIPVAGQATGTTSGATGTSAATGTSGATGTTGNGAAASTGPQVSHSVATTTASGVTVTTTTSTVNGKAVVTQKRSAPARGGDD